MGGIAASIRQVTQASCYLHKLKQEGVWWQNLFVSNAGKIFSRAVQD